MTRAAYRGKLSYMAKHDPDLNLIFTALGDPTRRAIIERLGRGPATVSELATPHDMALPSFMAHLARLERAGLVQTSKSGRIRSCRLIGANLAPVQGWLSQQRALWQARLDQFDDYVSTISAGKDNGS